MTAGVFVYLDEQTGRAQFRTLIYRMISLKMRAGTSVSHNPGFFTWGRLTLQFLLCKRLLVLVEVKELLRDSVRGGFILGIMIGLEVWMP